MVIFPVVENVYAHVNNAYHEDTHRSLFPVNIIKRTTIGPLVKKKTKKKKQSNGRLWLAGYCKGRVTVWPFFGP